RRTDMAKNVKDVGQQKITGNASDTAKVSTRFDINAEFRSVMHELGLFTEDTGGNITFVGEDPIFPSVHRLGACIGIPIMAGAAGGARKTRPPRRPPAAPRPSISSRHTTTPTPHRTKT